MTFLLALDQGTTSSRSIVFDCGGNIIAIAQREFQQHFPSPGWVEHDPRDLWRTELATMREALAQAKLSAKDIAAIGITNQRETTVVWDRRTGEPLFNAIVWQDRRSEPICAELRTRGLEPLFRERTGLVLDAYFSGTKIKWILDHLPGAGAAARRGELAFGTVDTWLVWQLTGGRLHVNDASNASRTPLDDIHCGCWDNELLAALDVPRETRSTQRSLGLLCRSGALPATSNRRCSARPASARGWPSHTLSAAVLRALSRGKSEEILVSHTQGGVPATPLPLNRRLEGDHPVLHRHQLTVMRRET